MLLSFIFFGDPLETNYLRKHWSDIYQTFINDIYLATIENMLCRFSENTPWNKRGTENSTLLPCFVYSYSPDGAYSRWRWKELGSSWRHCAPGRLTLGFATHLVRK